MIAKINEIFHSDRFAELTAEALAANEWITQNDIAYAIEALCCEFLDPEKLENFIDQHSIDTTPRNVRVGIVAAGNLPLVGFADMFYALICGYEVVVKPSTKDPLMRAFEAIDRVKIVDTIEELKSCDRLLAMGSDRTCALLADLFPATPTLLRGSMHSIAIVEGDQTTAEIEALAEDIFRYCARGCRSVTHIYLPVGYDVAQLKFAPRSMPTAWGDAYRYERARAIIGDENFVDGGYYLLKPSPTQATATIGYSFYDDPSQIDTTHVQHIARRGNFGCAQRPSLNDFANGANVVAFLA